MAIGTISNPTVCVMCQEMLMSLANVDVTGGRCVATCLFPALIIM